MITMHPGEYLKISYLEPMRISQALLAKKMSISTACLSRILNGKSDISVSMALKLEREFDRSAESWLSMQMDFRLDQARSSKRKEPVDPTPGDVQL